MLRNLFRFKHEPIAEPIRGVVPKGQRIYAIGDVHGRLDLLVNLIDQIDEDDRQRDRIDTHLIFLGDLIDRGPQSAQVIDHLIALKKDRPRTRFLSGNHEEMFEAALSGDLNALKLFIRVGGRETILSYGIEEIVYRELSFEELFEQFSSLVPAEHREFIAAFEDIILLGDYAFVHAGVRPNVPIDEQRSSDFRWIRKEFIQHQGPFEKIIVHGHTIFKEVQQDRFRISLDTGAYQSHTLTAMGFEGENRWILQT